MIGLWKIDIFIKFYSNMLIEFVWREFKTPSTLHRFQTKTILFCSGYGYHPHCNTENDSAKTGRSENVIHSGRFESGTVWKCCFPSVDGENDAIWKRWRQHNNTTGRGLRISQPWESKMADTRFHLASLLITMISRLVFWSSWKRI